MKHLGYELSVPDTVIDTLLCSQVLYPDIKGAKFPHRCPKKLSWSHSLEAWGHRLGQNKGHYDDWSKYTAEMGLYCAQDTLVNYEMYQHLKERAESIGVEWEFNDLPNALAVEHKFKYFITRQTLTGFPFDVEAAHKLVGPLLAEREQITEKLQEVFPPITETIEYITPKRKEEKTKTKTTVFNPSSRTQIAERLMAAGWEPTSFTNTGRPVIKEDTIVEASKVVPEAAVLDRYFVINKLIGSLANGSNAWLKLERGGIMHGSVNTLGAITTRVTHSKPNMSQVPSVNKPYGPECRSLFHAREGWKLIGADLAGIELRCLAHYLAAWDDGAYGKDLLEGDIHTVHQQAYKFPPGKEWRSVGKTVTYGLNGPCKTK